MLMMKIWTEVMQFSESQEIADILVDIVFMFEMAVT